MAERLDTTRFNDHDIDVLEGRISFDPAEVRDIADRLRYCNALEEPSAQQDKFDSIRASVRIIEEWTSAPAVYRLNKTRVADIANELDGIHEDLNDLENYDD